MTMRFSSSVEQCLRRAGWHPDRRVSLVALEQRLTDARLTPAARSLLEEFGWLHPYARGAGIECSKSDAHLDPELAHAPDVTEKLRPGLGPLFPLGEAVYGQARLYVAENGGIVGVADGDVVSEVGASIEEALETLLTGRNWRPIPLSVLFPSSSSDG